MYFYVIYFFTFSIPICTSAFCPCAVCPLRVFLKGRKRVVINEYSDAVSSSSSSSSSQSGSLVLSDSEGYKRMSGELYRHFCLQDITAVQIELQSEPQYSHIKLLFGIVEDKRLFFFFVYTKITRQL